MQCDIVQAGPADAGRLARLAALTFPLACPSFLSRADVEAKIEQVLSQSAFERYLTSRDHLVLLALTPGPAGAPLGYSMTVAGEPEEQVAACVTQRPTAELSKFYTVASAHGTGVAQQLMSATLARLNSWGLAGVWLAVNQLNVRAQRFYASSGFTPAGTRQFLVGHTVCDDYVMFRRSSPT